MRRLLMLALCLAPALLPRLAWSQTGDAPAVPPPPPASTTLGAPVAEAPPPMIVVPPPLESPAKQRLYARRGRIEVGGGGSLSGTKNSTTASVNLSAGYFLLNGFELSLIGVAMYTRASTVKVGDVFFGANSLNDKTAVGIFYGLLEPSYHLRLNERVFPFLGVGVGGVYNKPLNGVDGKAGLAVAPRVGLNFVVGPSSVITAAASALYMTADKFDYTDPVTKAPTQLSLELSYTLGVNFSVLF